HLNLSTSTEVDSLGRPTRIADANGNVTYLVYNDPDHEVRTYPGWDPATGRPTGPTVVTREDRGHTPSYVETLTMSAAPAAGRPGGGPRRPADRHRADQRGADAHPHLPQRRRPDLPPGGLLRRPRGELLHHPDRLRRRRPAVPGDQPDRHRDPDHLRRARAG